MKSELNAINKVFFDPSYAVFYGNKLFDLSDSRLNRDDQLLPLHRLKESAESKGVSVETADKIYSEPVASSGGLYFSMGLFPDYQVLADKNIRPEAFLLMEPPVVAPSMYRKLPDLTSRFARVYVHNTEGDGYSLDGVNKEALEKFYWPIPYRNVLEAHWNRRNRKNKIVVINGHHKPTAFKNELYSKRIEAMVALKKFGWVDLFGRDWSKLLTRRSIWLPYILNRRSLLKIYQGPSESKFQTLSSYDFCLCFENMAMKGYMTEKIFDCFYAGTIPLYLGAPDIQKYIPEEAYVDVSRFKDWEEMLSYVRSMSAAEIERRRQAGREFIEGAGALPYYNSLENIVRKAGVK